MIIHTEDVLSYVYGEPLHRRQEWDELNSYLDEWTAKRPPSFNPVWHSEPSESVFPEIWFANDFHGMSVAFPSQKTALMCCAPQDSC